MSKIEYTDNVMLSRQLPLKSVALILAGGRGTRLKDLTTIRANLRCILAVNSELLILPYQIVLTQE